MSKWDDDDVLDCTSDEYTPAGEPVCQDDGGITLALGSRHPARYEQELQSERDDDFVRQLVERARGSRDTAPLEEDDA